MHVRTLQIKTDGTGAFTGTMGLRGEIVALELILGTLSTPDVDVTDDIYSVSLLSVNGVAADTVYTPSRLLDAAAGTTIADTYARAVVMGRLKVEVTGGGASTSGLLRVLINQ